MKKPQIAVVAFLLLLLGGTLFVTLRNSGSGSQAASYRQFVNLVAGPPVTFSKTIDEIDRHWHSGAAVMLTEVGRFARTPGERSSIVALLQRRTGQEMGYDFDRWYQWHWSRAYQPHPEYSLFKSELYSYMDSRFREYFQATESARIRLDEILWGGVARDGIPPLKDPQMISAEDATYLDESDVVFGVILKGDARCYPKRILAWHEMFKDTVGGVPVCGVY